MMLSSQWLFDFSFHFDYGVIQYIFVVCVSSNMFDNSKSRKDIEKLL